MAAPTHVPYMTWTRMNKYTKTHTLEEPLPGVRMFAGAPNEIWCYNSKKWVKYIKGESINKIPKFSLKKMMEHEDDKMMEHEHFKKIWKDIKKKKEESEVLFLLCSSDPMWTIYFY